MMTIDTDPTFDPHPFMKIPYMIQALLVMWVPKPDHPEGGEWLTTRRGIVICGPNVSEIPPEEMLILEVGAGYRAMRRRLEKDGLLPDG